MIRRLALAAGLAAALCASAAGNAQAMAVQTNPNPSGVAPCADAITSARAMNCTLTPVAGRDFNVSAWGTFVAGFQLERSFDGGTTWLPITAAGTALYQWTAPESESASEAEAGVQYRVRVTAYTSGTVNVRLSQ